MLQQKQPDDYVIATGNALGERTGRDRLRARRLDWQSLRPADPAFLRPAEVDHLIGDCSKSETTLGWEPKVTFRELVKMMVDADMERHGAKPVSQRAK